MNVGVVFDQPTSFNIHIKQINRKAFSFQASSVKSAPVWIWGTDTFFTLRPRLKRSFLIKLIFRTESGDPEPSLSYAAIQFSYWCYQLMNHGVYCEKRSFSHDCIMYC